MADVVRWIEERIATHRVGRDASPAALQRLLSACAALAGRGGTVFGLMQPTGGYPDAERLYRLGCDALREWMVRIDDETLRSLLAEAIVRHGLAVEVPGDLRKEPRRPESEELLRVVERLEAAGCSILRAEDAPVPTDEEVEDLASRLAPHLLPDALRAWLARTPSRLALAWVHEPTGLQGHVDYDIGRIPELHDGCSKQVTEWLDGLEHYYGVWREASPFIELDHGQGFIAVGARGEVVYLDNEGHTDLNGACLGTHVDSFWSTWRDLAFVALEPDVLEAIRREGFAASMSLGRAVAVALQPRVTGRR